MYHSQLTTLTDLSRIFRTTSLLRSLEALGGEVGFKQWAATPKAATTHAANTSRRPKNAPYSTPISMNSGSLVAYTWISVDAPINGYAGSGGCWGVGLGAIQAGGVLLTNDPFADFVSQTVSFRILEDAEETGGALLQFMDGENGVIGVAALIAGGIGAFVGLKGDFRWS